MTVSAIDPEAILCRVYSPGSRLLRRVMTHGRQVAQKALEVAANVAHLNPDTTFIWEAAMLHDIGVIYTDVPELGCMGVHPYICHGLLGRVILEQLGLHRHAMVCERHVGVGISREDIVNQKMPLPLRDMVPVTIEEQIICYADKFFSKSPHIHDKELNREAIVASLSRYGQEKVRRFEQWDKLFSGPQPRTKLPDSHGRCPK